MKNQEITVVYRWNAKPGKGNELKKIYVQVENDMKETEPNAHKVDCFFDETTGTLIV